MDASAPAAPDPDDEDELVERVSEAARALVAVAARALAAVDDDVTLPQLRALVVLATEGPRTMGALAGRLDVRPSSATRLGDRLEGRGLVRREAADDRREVRLVPTAAGEALVARVTERRRADIRRILGAMSGRERRQVLASLDALARAAEPVVGPVSRPATVAP